MRNLELLQRFANKPEIEWYYWWKVLIVFDFDNFLSIKEWTIYLHLIVLFLWIIYFKQCTLNLVISYALSFFQFPNFPAPCSMSKHSIHQRLHFSDWIWIEKFLPSEHLDRTKKNDAVLGIRGDMVFHRSFVGF